MDVKFLFGSVIFLIVKNILESAIPLQAISKTIGDGCIGYLLRSINLIAAKKKKKKAQSPAELALL
jgi:hypothetical protein